MSFELTIERGLLIRRLRRVEAEELGKLATVLRVLVNTELQVLSEGLVELLGVLLVFADLG